MSLEQIYTPAYEQHYEDARLRGNWLIFIRAAWIILVLLILGMCIVSLPTSFAIFKTPCTGVECTSNTGQLRASDILMLQRLGISFNTYVFYWLALYITIVLTWCIMGGVLAWRKSDNWFVLLIALMLIATGASLITDNLLLNPSRWQISEGLFYGFKSLVILFTLALFPNGRFVPRWIGWIPLLYPAQLLLYLVFLQHLHLPGWSLYRSPLNAIMWFGCEAVLVLAQLYRYIRVSNQVEHQQTRWVAFSFFLLLIADFGSTAVENVLSIQQIGLLYVFILSILACLFLAMPLSIGVAVLRYRLWDIDIIINRTLVYGVLTACIIGMYVLIVGYLGAIFRTGNNLFISLVATSIVAALFQPLRAALQRGVNRLFYGQRDEPYKVITGLSQRLEATLATDAILPTVAETVAQTLKLPYVAILLKQDDEYTVAASYSSQQRKTSKGRVKEPITPLILPLLYQKEPVGKLHLAPRTPGERFTPSDQQLVNELTRQIGVAAHAVRLTSDLQRSNEHLRAARARLVTTREEERRRLRRDLHDGLGPTLAALTLKIGAARKLLTRDSARAEMLLLELNSDIETTVAEIRRLVYDLRPPTLDDLGLVGAIHERIARYSIDDIHIQMEAPEQLPSLPAAVEVAAFRITQEALTNVIRHAHAHNCHIRIAFDDNMLTLEICDDGVGMTNERHSGIGIRSMYERAAELDGTCIIEPCENGGTRILVHLPVFIVGA